MKFYLTKKIFDINYSLPSQGQPKSGPKQFREINHLLFINFTLLMAELWTILYMEG